MILYLRTICFVGVYNYFLLKANWRSKPKQEDKVSEDVSGLLDEENDKSMIGVNATLSRQSV